jgi:hypothetical protein
MARSNVTHDFRPHALRAVVSNPRGGVARDMYRRGQNVRAEAIRRAGGRTGHLRGSITNDLVPRNGSWAARIASRLHYAGVHHEGHGPIRPRRAGGVLRFRGPHGALGLYPPGRAGATQ